MSKTKKSKKRQKQSFFKQNQKTLLVSVLIISMVALGAFSFTALSTFNIGSSPGTSNQVLDWQSDVGDTFLSQLWLTSSHDNGSSGIITLKFNMTHNQNIDTEIPINENLTYYNWTVSAWNTTNWIEALNSSFMFNVNVSGIDMFQFLMIPFSYGNHEVMDSILERHWQVVGRAINNTIILNYTSSYQEITYQTVPELNIHQPFYTNENILDGGYSAVRYDNVFYVNDTSANETVNITMTSIHDSTFGIQLHQSYSLDINNYDTMENESSTIVFKTIGTSRLIPSS